jgi:hypothetical protein
MKKQQVKSLNTKKINAWNSKDKKITPFKLTAHTK